MCIYGFFIDRYLPSFFLYSILKYVYLGKLEHSFALCYNMCMIKRSFLLSLFLILLVAICLPSGNVLALALADLPIKKDDYGTNVVLIQQRLIDLGYLNFRTTGTYGDMTKDAVQNFQRRNEITPRSGEIDEATYQALFSKTVVRVSSSPVVQRIAGPRLVNPTTFGELTPWSQVKEEFAVDVTAIITDLYTGYTFAVKRIGGENHAKVQAVSVEDHVAYVKCFGGSYTWEKRPALVTLAGKTYAASLFGMPNGASTLMPNKSEGMPGSTDLYFYESASDIGGIEDVEHTTNVYTASSAAGTVK